jgi:hypothetical protein
MKRLTGIVCCTGFAFVPPAGTGKDIVSRVLNPLSFRYITTVPAVPDERKTSTEFSVKSDVALKERPHGSDAAFTTEPPVLVGASLAPPDCGVPGLVVCASTQKEVVEERAGVIKLSPVPIEVPPEDVLNHANVPVPVVAVNVVEVPAQIGLSGPDAVGAGGGTHCP